MQGSEDMQLHAVESQRLYQQIAQQIGALIRGGTYRPGEKLPPERDLARSLSVSRPVVREAMVALELAGLVEVRTGAGTFVQRWQDGAETRLPFAEPGDAGPSPFEIIAARRVIEGETAAIAAHHATPEDLARISEAIDRMARDIDHGVQAVDHRDDGDLLFHVHIAKAARNSILEDMVSQLWLGMTRPLFTTISRKVRLPENARTAVNDHRLVFERIAAHDSSGARAAMHRHIDIVLEIMLTGDDAEFVETTEAAQ